MKNKIKKNLIVTLANDDYLDKAKQVLSSVYFNAGWKGDYLLLAHDINDKKLTWFINKGIQIYKTKKLGNHTGPGNYPPVVLSKFYLLKKYFKQWDKIIFLDADIIVRSSLNNLLSLSGFNAPEAETNQLKDQFIKERKIISKYNLNKHYNLEEKSCCTGVFVFDSSIIKEDSFKNLLNLYQEYRDLAIYGEESIFNLYFYKNWNRLPFLYNFNPDHAKRYYNANIENSPAVIIHFGWSISPWKKNSPYYGEWYSNFANANKINLKIRPQAKQFFSQDQLDAYIKRVDRIKKYRLIILYIDRQIGKIGKIFRRSISSTHRKYINK